MTKRRVLVLLSLTLATAPASALAGKNPYHEQQAAMARQQQQMIQQQKKLMEQHQKAMQQEQQRMLRQQQQWMQQHQKAMQQEQQRAKAAQQASAKAPANTNAKVATTPHPKAEAKATSRTSTTTTTTKTTAKPHAAARAAGVHHAYMRWPQSSTTAYRHLMQLKHSLEAIGHKSTPAPQQVAHLGNSLMNVVMSAPKPPSGHVQTLSNHLAAALSSRTSATVDTKDLALALRAAMNGPRLTEAEGEQALATAKQVLGRAGVGASHVNTIAGDMTFLANETQASLR